MAKIIRQTAQTFGTSAGTGEIAEFGSLAAGTPTRYSGATATPNLVQALGNWAQGWRAAQEGISSIATEDLNAFCYVMAYQAAYLMQAGIAEWDAATTYYIGSLVNDGLGNIYKSLTNANLNNALSSGGNWQILVSSSVSQLSASCGSFNTVSTTPVDITSLAITITTYGKPVVLTMISDVSTSISTPGIVEVSTSGSNGLATINCVRGVSTYAGAQSIQVVGSTTNLLTAVPSSSFVFVDFVPAGTYNYKLQAFVNAGTTTCSVGFSKLYASS